MTVWIVGVADCESNSIAAICSTKEIAERELFKVRDEYIVNWKRMYKKFEDNMYKEMIDALSGNDYEKWNNYPHDRPYLYDIEVIDK